MPASLRMSDETVCGSSPRCAPKEVGAFGYDVKWRCRGSVWDVQFNQQKVEWVPATAKVRSSARDIGEQYISKIKKIKNWYPVTHEAKRKNKKGRETGCAKDVKMRPDLG